MKKKLKIALAVAVALVAILGIGLWMGAIRLTRPTATAGVASLRAEPYSDELLAAVARWREARARFTDAEIQSLAMTSPESRNESDGRFAALIAAFEASIARDDFTLEAMEAGPPGPKSTFPPMNLDAQWMAKILEQEANHHLLGEEYDDASAAAEKIVRIARVDPYPTATAGMMGVAVLNVATRTWLRAIEACEDPAALRAMLDRQIAPAPTLRFRAPGVAPNEADQIGMLRQLQRRGVDVKLDGLNLHQLMAESLKGQADLFERVLIPAADPTHAATLKVALPGYRLAAQEYARMGSPGYYFKHPLRTLSLLMLKRMAKSTFDEIEANEKIALAKFDLLRLETARKLYTLERGVAPGSIDRMVPDVLPEVLPDRFGAGEPYRWGEGHYYSIGPDGVDDLGATAFRPPVGANNPGDIWVKDR